MITIRSFIVLGLSLIAGLAIFGAQIGRAVKTGREFDRYLTVRGLSEREVKATLAISFGPSRRESSFSSMQSCFW